MTLQEYPTIDDLLADPLIRAVMRADHVEPVAFRSQMVAAAVRIAAGKVRSPSSVGEVSECKASSGGIVRTTRGSETLARVPLFALLGLEDVRALDSRCVWRRVSAGDWVVDDHAQGTDVYFVLRGHVRAVIPSSGHELILSDLRDGEYFGAVSAIDGQPIMCGVIAITDTVIARMNAVVFREAFDRYPSVRAGVLATLAQAIRVLGKRAIEHAQLHVRERLCAELLRLSRTSAKGRVVVSPPPTHAELAARIDTRRREAVTRLLKELEREGAIARTRGAIELIDPDHLRRIVAGRGEHRAA
jgi:CRP-like cAMP-binding protein